MGRIASVAALALVGIEGVALNLNAGASPSAPQRLAAQVAHRLCVCAPRVTV